jgi:lysophospholipase L1-like esterase
MQLKSFFIVVLLATMSLALQAEIVVKSGEIICFLGDSITAYGGRFNGGYLKLVMKGLEVNGIKAKAIPAGVGGNKSNQMLKRFERDLFPKKPNILLLSCGVNDVWHGAKGVPLDQYKKNITAIVDKALGAGMKVCLLTPTVITENPKDARNVRLTSYIAFLLQLAKDKNCMIADLNKDMWMAIANFKMSNPFLKGNLVTYDGVHMNPYGDTIMATGVLKALGCDNKQIQKAKNAWKKMTTPQIGKVEFNGEDFLKLATLAAKKKMTIQEYLVNLVKSQNE